MYVTARTLCGSGMRKNGYDERGGGVTETEDLALTF